MRRILLAAMMGLLLLGVAACAPTSGSDGWGGHTISLFPPSSSDG